MTVASLAVLALVVCVPLLLVADALPSVGEREDESEDEGSDGGADGEHGDTGAEGAVHLAVSAAGNGFAA